MISLDTIKTESVEAVMIGKDFLFSLVSNPFFKLIGGLALSWFTGLENLILIMMLLVILDIISGVLVAIKNKQLSSCGFSRAVWKIVAYMFAIFTVRLIELGALDGVVTFTKLMISVLTMTEGISILENSVALGLPLPRAFLILLSQANTNKRKRTARIVKMR